MTATEHEKQQLGLPFDQHQRYRIVADALDQLREDSGTLEVLDVGGGEGIILNFLSGDRVTILDQTEVEGVPGFVVGDATALPFEEGSFDYVTSLDVYEHVEREAREKYLRELRRVARKGVLLAAPFDSEEVREAERVANEFHRAMHLKDNIWLIEHEQNGLPNLDWTRAYFEQQGDEVYILPNGYLPHWLPMISLFFYEAYLEGESRHVLDRLNRFYNGFMYEHDNAEPSYRHLVVALKDAPHKEDIDLHRLSSTSDHPSPVMSSALFAAFSATLAPVAELKRLSIQLAHKDNLLVQKDAQLKKLNGRLANKDIQARDLFERLAKQVAAANIVPGLRKQAAALKEDREQLKQRLGEMKQQVSALREDREQLKQQVSALREDREQLKHRLDEMKQQAAALKTDKSRLAQRLDGLSRQLDAIKSSRAWRIIEKQRNLRIALRNSLRGRSTEEDG